MAKNKKELISEILEHMKKRGGAFSDWYIGITNDARRRVIDEHGIEKEKDKYIWRTVLTSDKACEVENYFLEKGCDGGGGGGDSDSNIVYAYKKSSRTNP